MSNAEAHTTWAVSIFDSAFNLNHPYVLDGYVELHLGHEADAYIQIDLQEVH